MMIDDQNPLLEALLQRLVGTPQEFQDEPVISSRGNVHVAALVHDLYSLHGAMPSIEVLDQFVSNASQDRNRLQMVAIMAWLLSDAWFVQKKLTSVQLGALLLEVTNQLASQTTAQFFIQDADRREELVRLCLSRLGLRPKGETVEQSADRLSRISGIERQRLLAASRQAEERARAIRVALVRKAAEESADKWGRE
jgi:hypothetical protein